MRAALLFVLAGAIACSDSSPLPTTTGSSSSSGGAGGAGGAAATLPCEIPRGPYIVCHDPGRDCIGYGGGWSAEAKEMSCDEEFEASGTCESDGAIAYCLNHQMYEGGLFTSVSFYYDSFSMLTAELACEKLDNDDSTVAFCPL